ncbi:hypothetical protein AGMMS49975_19590 [Clostridia bacterium]|nr:hypothetical protein AGMMS49975_19590 [Clostridia bacterium]
MLITYMARTGKEKKIIVKELDTSHSGLSQFLGGTYTSPHTFVPKVQNLVQMYNERMAAPKEPPFQETAISKQVWETIRYAHIQHQMAVVYGDAAVYVNIPSNMGTMATLDYRIAKKLRVSGKNSVERFEHIIETLSGSNKVIIVDEAQELTAKAIDHLRAIYDEACVGVVLIGNEKIKETLRGIGDSQERGRTQLFSRIMHGSARPVHTKHITLEDIKKIFEYAGLNEDCLKLLHQISQTGHGLRGSTNVFVNTVIMFDIGNYTEITKTQLARSAKDMGIV